MEKDICYREMENGDYSDTSLTYIPSGFKNMWLVVSEDPTYDITVRYARGAELDKINAEAKARKRTCFACGELFDVSRLCPKCVQGGNNTENDTLPK